MQKKPTGTREIIMTKPTPDKIKAAMEVPEYFRDLSVTPETKEVRKIRRDRMIFARAYLDLRFQDGLTEEVASSAKAQVSPKIGQAKDAIALLELFRDGAKLAYIHARYQAAMDSIGNELNDMENEDTARAVEDSHKSREPSPLFKECTNMVRGYVQLGAMEARRNG